MDADLMMSLKRWLVRLILLLCGAASLLSITAAFYFKGANAIEAWLVVAAALAVLTSMMSAWSAQITIEIQENTLKPDVIIYIDVSERYQLMQLRMRNIGKSSAFNILDVWDSNIIDKDGEGLRFADRDNKVSVLHADQNLSKAIDVPWKFYQRYNEGIYRGYVSFSDASGRKYRNRFVINPKQYLKTLMRDQEASRTHYDIQQIPKKLDEIKMEMKNIAFLLRPRKDIDLDQE